MKIHVFSFLTALALCVSVRAQLVINEVMQSNIDCVMDELNDFPDSWVELYNAGTVAEELSAYSLGETVETAWRLPSMKVGAKCFCLIYCDKVGQGRHTNFRLDTGKDCALLLVKGGEVADRLPEGMKKQPAPNIAYGRKMDGGEEWGYQLTATPGKANCREVCDAAHVLGVPVFSIPGRVIKKGVTCRVALSLPEGCPDGTEIRYTDDGSEPTAQSKLYAAPIMMSSSKVIRARLFCQGWLSPRSVTHSYLKFDRDVTLPVISITTDRRYFYDSKLGIYVDGSYGQGKKNYEYNWRRPINLEYFDGDLEHSVLNQLCETRVTGGASRGAGLKSLGVYAHKRFGEKHLDYEFFPEQRPGVTGFKSVMLRNAGNDFDYLYMRDAVIQSHMAQYLDLDWQAWSPAIFFLNGEYKGILNVRERSNENNIYTNYDGLEDIDMVENWWELKNGTIDSWLEFQNFYSEQGHTWDEYEERMDVQEFMDVMIMNLYFCNLDFPGNNIVMWRPQAEGGRWRVVVKDTDFGIGLYGRSVDYKIIQWLYNPNFDRDCNWGANSSEGTRLFRRLMDDERFNREFIDRFAIYMGDFMNFDRVWETWEPMYERIKYEYPSHRALFNRWWPNYNEELNSAKTWLRGRTAKMYDQLNAYYAVGTPKPLNIYKPDGEEASITFNGVKLSRGTFNGKFFAGREINLSGENVVAWEVTQILPTGPLRLLVEGPEYSFTIPTNCTSVNITPTVEADGIATVVSPSQPDAIYDLSGVKHNVPTRGVNIVRRGGKAVKVVVNH